LIHNQYWFLFFSEFTLNIGFTPKFGEFLQG